MKKGKKLLSIVCVFCVMLSVMGSAYAAGPQRAKPWDNEKISVGTSSKSYSFAVQPQEPCVRVWVKNTSDKGALKVVVKDEDGATVGSATVEAGESTATPIEIEYYGSKKVTWKVVFSNGSSGSVKSVSGVFAVRTGEDWSSMALAAVYQE